MLMQKVPITWIIDDLDLIISTICSIGNINYCSLTVKFKEEIFQKIRLISYKNITSTNAVWDVNVFKFTNINNIRVNSFVEDLDNIENLRWSILNNQALYNSWLFSGKNNDSLIIKFPDKETQTEFNLIYRK